jgi:hypothetical protein
MPSNYAQLPTGVDFPEAGSPVLTAGQQPSSIMADGHRFHGAGVAP